MEYGIVWIVSRFFTAEMKAREIAYMDLRKIIFWSHLTVGIFLGIGIFSMAASGVLLAFRSQIEAFTEREVRYVSLPSQDMEKLDFSRALTNIHRKFPHISPNNLTFYSNPAASVVLGFGPDRGMIYLNPYTGDILGHESKMRRFLSWVQEWHRWLGSEKMGKPMTGLFCIGMFFMVLSGLYLWWPRERNGWLGMVLFNKRLRGKARNRNWHSVVGFWCSPFLLTITLTGIIMSYAWANALLFKITGNRPPIRMEKKDHKTDEGEWIPVKIDALRAWMDHRVPRWKSVLLRLPQKEGDPLHVTILESDLVGPITRSQLKIHASTGEIITWEPYSEQNLGIKLRTWVRYLHTGEVFGPLGQMMMCLGAVGAMGLVWSGFVLAWHRFLGERSGQ